MMPTGKNFREVLMPQVSNSAGKWSGTRIFQVDTTSPSVAILTIQDDASIPLGTSWTEGCDPDYAAASTSSIRMKSSAYDTRALSGSVIEVTIKYEDARYRVEFDETKLGFVRRYFKYAMTSELITVAQGNVEAWDKDNRVFGFTPTVTLPDSSITVPDQRVGWDGENLTGANIDIPQLVYGEVWRLNDEGRSVWGSSNYVPGIYDSVNIAARLSNDETYAFCKRLGLPYDPNNVTVPYWMILFAFTGTANSELWRSRFTPQTLLMLPPQINQVGEIAWICNFEFVFSPSWFYDASSGMEDPKIYLYNQELEALVKYGQEYLWHVLEKDANDERSIVKEIRVAKVKDTLDFTALGLEL